MKLTKEIKEKIDAYFLSKTPEELEYITSKYIAGCDPYKKDSPIVVYEQMDNGCIRPYDKQSIVDRIKEAQEEYNKLLDKLNKETPSE